MVVRGVLTEYPPSKCGAHFDVFSRQIKSRVFSSRETYLMLRDSLAATSWIFRPMLENVESVRWFLQQETENLRDLYKAVRLISNIRTLDASGAHSQTSCLAL